MTAFTRRAALAALTIALAAPLRAQTPSDTDKETAGKLSAQGWLVLLDRRDWGTAWETSSAVFRKGVPLGSWMDAIPKVRDALGAVLDRQVVQSVYKTTLAGQPDGDYVTVIFASKFERKPEVREAVTVMREADGRWRVTGYSPG